MPQEKKDSVGNEVMGLIDTDKNGFITKDEWMAFCEKGQSLPDFGLGPGHHGDDEYEYEIHHWEKCECFFPSSHDLEFCCAVRKDKADSQKTMMKTPKKKT